MSFNPEHTHFDPEGAVNRVFRLDVMAHALPHGMQIDALVEYDSEELTVETYRVDEDRMHLLDAYDVPTSFFVAEGLLRVNESFTLRTARHPQVERMARRVLELYVDAVDFSRPVAHRLSEDSIHADLARD